ncbi:MAG TPA: sigma 54-interacting transcriptional regulator [Gemmatimonadales bacterium]
MSTGSWWVAVVPLSDSFRQSVAELAAAAGAGLVEWRPSGSSVIPPDATLILVLAGGAEADALDLLAAIGKDVPCYVVGAAPDHRIAAGAVAGGARDYFALPDDTDLLRRALEAAGRAVAADGGARSFAESERRANGFDAIIGRSPALQAAIAQAARVAAHKDVTVMIGGETGTGKELLARALHYESPRAAQPFVEINCAAIPANLLESELFGHEKGAFTGAVAAKPGLFEVADGGTLFLDEIATLPLELQPKLLRALEGREFRRVGGQRTLKADVRIVAASHVRLADAVARGEFREDLYYRLNIVALTLPPLRERNGDVELLAETFVQRISTGYGLPVPPLTPEFRAMLRARRWPGNVRELRNAIERALVLSPAGTLRADELPEERPADDGAAASGIPFPADLGTISRAAARAMLGVTGGNKSEAARRLGISRPRLQRLLDGFNDD